MCAAKVSIIPDLCQTGKMKIRPCGSRMHKLGDLSQTDQAGLVTAGVAAL